MSRAAPALVLLDRDGTINVDHGYVGDPAKLDLLEGAIDGLRRIAAFGFTLAIVTNQSGIARGLMTAVDAAAVNAALCERLADAGITIAAVAMCPHHPADACYCRKPAQGLARAVADATGLGLDGAIVIGDKASDMGLAHAIGARGILIANPGSPAHGQQATARDLMEAATVIEGWVAEAAAPS